MKRYWRLALILLIVPVLVCPLYLLVQTGQAYGAPDTLDLQLDDPAIIRWDIIDIMPGDSGIEPINLHNAGDIPGYIYIWLSDIVDGEGLNPESETGNTVEPGELSSYIILDIINPGMNFGKLKGNGYMQYYDLPVVMASFPNSSNQALFIIATTINPGETLELQWQWQLPLSAGNVVQGDTLSFTFNYMLSSFYTEEEEEEPSEPPPYFPPPTLPSTTPVTTPPRTEPPEPPVTDEPEDDIDITDDTDISYVVLITPDTSTPAMDEEKPSDNKAVLAQASLGLAVSGTVAMTTLAVIERIRRYRRMKMGN